MHPKERLQMSLNVSRRLKLGVMGLICLMVILVVAGCNIRQFFGGEPSRQQLENKFWAGVRPASGETDRLLRNFRYLKQVGRTHLALKELEQAHQQDPGNPKVIDILAQCYEELGAWDRAEKLYLETLAKDQDNAALANNLCFSYYQAGKLDKAEACFRDLLKRHPENAAVRNNLGLLLAKTGRQDEAHRLWREEEGETVARERLHQALAALGIAPQVKVARLPEPKAAAPVAPLPGAASSPAPAKDAATRPVQPATPTQPSASTAAQVPEALPVAAPVAPNSLTSQAIGKQADVAAATAKPDAQLARPTGETPATVTAPPSPVADARAPSAPVKPAAEPASPAPAPAKPEPAAIPAKPPVKQVKAAAPKPRGFLTTQELVNTRLEILNGNGVKGIAALNRTWLTMEGFTVEAIGNHLDFGMQNTLIQYHPDAERLAKALQEDFFPQADLKPNGKLGKDADVKIVLGREQKARKSQIEERIALLDLRAQLALILAAPEKAPTGQKTVTAPKPQTATARSVAQAPPTAPAAPAAPVPAAKPKAEAVKLTPAELSQAKIELRNGNGVQDQARRLRSELNIQGFKVVRIKNHIDFGMEQTTILYRAGAAKVAQALGTKFFTTAKLAESDKLPGNVDVKIILGKDLPGGLDLMAQLAH